MFLVQYFCFKVVTSVWSAVKELVENAIDAEATHIEVILELFQSSSVITYVAHELSTRHPIGHSVRGFS